MDHADFATYQVRLKADYVDEEVLLWVIQKMGKIVG